MSDRNEWLNGLKAGDEVVYSGGWSLQIMTVTRVTAKQIIVGGARYWKKNGMLVGGGAWTSASIHEPTLNLRGQMQAKKWANTLREVQWSKVAPFRLMQIIELLPKRDAQ